MALIKRLLPGSHEKANIRNDVRDGATGVIAILGCSVSSSHLIFAHAVTPKTIKPVCFFRTALLDQNRLPTSLVGAQQRLRCHAPQILLRQEEGKKIAARNRREQVAQAASEERSNGVAMMTTRTKNQFGPPPQCHYELPVLGLGRCLHPFSVAIVGCFGFGSCLYIKVQS